MPSRANTTLEVNEPAELLAFLLANLKGKSRNNIKSLLSHGEVTVDGKSIKQFNHLLRPGQTVEILHSVGRGLTRKEAPVILFEDNDLLVVDKPAGLLSIATDKERERTAYNIMTDYVRGRSSKNRLFIVHRIDRDTSGVLLFAKNEQMKNALQDNWNSLVTERAYIAIVEGTPQSKSGRIHTWLRETKTRLMYSGKVGGDGLEAVTNYKVIRTKGNNSTLYINLETGRKNQIRVHMKELGHCIVGDKKYGAKTDPLGRMGLHAVKLALKHPFTTEQLTFEAKPPKGFGI